jgi:hypothetical protein
MNGYSSGPWTVAEDGVSVVDADERILAVVVGDQARGNATLISAATELALVAESVLALESETDAFRALASFHDLVALACVALDKAKGK